MTGRPVLQSSKSIAQAPSTKRMPLVPPAGDGRPSEERYIGAFGEENWLDEWTVFGPESDYDPQEANAE